MFFLLLIVFVLKKNFFSFSCFLAFLAPNLEGVKAMSLSGSSKLFSGKSWHWFKSFLFPKKIFFRPIITLLFFSFLETFTSSTQVVVVDFSYLSVVTSLLFYTHNFMINFQTLLIKKTFFIIPHIFSLGISCHSHSIYSYTLLYNI